MNKKVIITGGAGFVGINLAQTFLEKGYEVELWDIGDRLKRIELSKILDNKNVIFTRTDLSNATPEGNYTDVEMLYHLAALPHVDYSRFEPRQVIQNNIASLLNVLDFSLQKNIPIIFSSSVEVYGGKENHLYKETDRLDPLSPYAASKAGCEAIINSYVECFGLKAILTRFTNLYGPWQAPDRLVPRLITQFIEGIGCEIEDGTLRDLIYVTDACEALFQLRKVNQWGQVYNLSSGAGQNNTNICRIIQANDTFTADVKYIKPRKNDGRGMYLVASPEKIQSAIKWESKIPLSEGIKHTIDWYKNNPLWWKQFEESYSSKRNTKTFIIDSSTWTENI